jgi:hypothetical protein
MIILRPKMGQLQTANLNLLNTLLKSPPYALSDCKIILEWYLKQNIINLIKTRSAKSFLPEPVLIEVGPLISFSK